MNEWQLNIEVTLYNMQGMGNLRLNEQLNVKKLTYEQMSNVFRAFHLVTSSIKEGTQLEVNGQRINY